MVSGPMISVLEADPELGAGLGPSDLSQAKLEAFAPVMTLKAGPWHCDLGGEERTRHLGLLVLDGLLTGSQTVGELCSIELLGKGDLLRPWTRDRHAVLGMSWEVILPVRLAVLDQDFAWRVRRWPQISAALLDRAMLRSRSLGVRLAIHRAVRVQDRVQLTLWHLAHRWGRVTPAGTILPIPLTHEALAQLVGARRSPVTIAIRDLERQGLVERGPKRSWLLRGEPPEL